MRERIITIVSILISAVIFFGGLMFFRWVFSRKSTAPPKPDFEQLDIDRSSSVVVYFFKHQEHDYLMTHRGGIIHSESCTNHISTGLQ